MQITITVRAWWTYICTMKEGKSIWESWNINVIPDYHKSSHLMYIICLKCIACKKMSEDFKHLQCLFSFGISRGSFISHSPSQFAQSLEKSPILEWEKRRAGISQISINYVPKLALIKSCRWMNIKHNCFA